MNLNKTATAKRPLAILVAGPLHLFRTTGIYYVYALARFFDVIIVGFENYSGDQTVEIVRRWPGVLSIEELPLQQNRFAFHRAAVKLAKRLARMAPSLLLQHSESYVYNFYFSAAMPASTVQGSYAAGQTLDQEKDFPYIQAERSAALARRFKIPSPLAPLAYSLRETWNSALHYTLFPLLLVRHSAKPRQNPMTGKCLPNRKTRSEFRLMYSAREITLHQRVLPGDNLVLVKHPMARVASDVHRSLGLSEERKGIAFLPTWGMTTELSSQIGTDAAFRKVYQSWESALFILRQRLGPLPIRVKLHPAAAKDAFSCKLAETLAANLGGTEVFDPSFSAEQIVLASSCVLGDVSSILWWTYMLGGRQIVSVQAWETTFGDEMRHYPGVVCVTDPAELANVPLPIAEVMSAEGLDAIEFILSKVKVLKKTQQLM